MRNGLWVAGIVGWLCASIGLSVDAGAASKRPSAPKQLCIGSKCVSTNTAASGKVKWNPGHYGASATIMRLGDPFSKLTYEMDDMLKDDWIKGYRLMISWSALDVGPVNFTASVGNATSGTLTNPINAGTYWVAFGNGEYRQVTFTDTTSATWSGPLSGGNVTSAHIYDTGVVDQVLNRLKTNYKSPKQLVMVVVPMAFSHGTRSSNDNYRIPRYITSNPAYGPSPDGSSYGWWGPPPGQDSGYYSAAIYRPAVAAQYAALGQALGAKYDADPNFEALMDQETSAVTMPAIHFPPSDGSYSDDAYVAQMKVYLSAWVAAFPHTSVIMENTWLRAPGPTQQFETWMMQNRVAPGTSDISGQSYYDADSTRQLSNWGLAAYAGQSVPGSGFSGPDMRGSVRAMVDVEGPDIGTGTGLRIGASVQDLVNGINKTVMASHAFWCYAPGGPAPTPKWADVTAVLQKNPLTSIGYPANYP